MREHGTYTCAIHGPNTGDFNQRCRCEPCHQAFNAYERDRRRRQHVERWHPERARWVDAEPVRQHLRSLMASYVGGHDGVGLKQISKTSGVSLGTISKLLYGQRRRDGTRRPPAKRVHRNTRTKLMAVTRADAAMSSELSEIETRQMLKLVAEMVAWYNAEVGAFSGNGYGRHRHGGKRWLGRQVHGPRAKTLQLRGKRISVRSAGKIQVVHDKLLDTQDSFWRYCKCGESRVERAWFDATPIRERLNGNISLLAKRSGITRRSLHRIKSGETTRLRRNTADRLALALDAEPTHLWGDW